MWCADGAEGDYESTRAERKLGGEVKGRRAGRMAAMRNETKRGGVVVSPGRRPSTMSVVQTGRWLSNCSAENGSSTDAER